MRRLALACAAALSLAIPPRALAQDFAPAAASGPQPGALALLERALPCAPGATSLELSATRWLSLASLETRAVALEISPMASRIAIGLSQTGEPSLGWTSLALAAGGAGETGGGGLRAIARLDRATGDWGAVRLAHEGGIEAGAGAWLAVGSGVRLWASAPQAWLAGAAPPLLRPAELGARVSGEGISAWVALVAPRRGDDGERVAGVSLGRAPLEAWAEARDGPLRASVGVRAAARRVGIEARADAHPVLGETTRIAISWSTARGGPP